MKKILVALVLALALAFAMPNLAFATGDVTLNITYTGPGGLVEGDFVGFKIYRDEVPIHTTSDGEPIVTWVDANLPDPPAGGYAYRVVAYESEGIDGPEWTGMVFWQTWEGGLGGSISVEVVIDK